MLLLSIRDMLFIDKHSTVWQKKIHIKILEDKCFFFCKEVNISEIQRYILATVTQQTTLPSIATTKQNLSQDQHQLSTETILLNFCRDQHQLSTETILLIFRNDQHLFNMICIMLLGTYSLWIMSCCSKYICMTYVMLQKSIHNDLCHVTENIFTLSSMKVTAENKVQNNLVICTILRTYVSI